MSVTIFNPFYLPAKAEHFKDKYKHYICAISIWFDSNCTYVSNFHPLEVVGHKMQLEVGEKLILELFQRGDRRQKHQILIYNIDKDRKRKDLNKTFMMISN